MKALKYTMALAMLLGIGTLAVAQSNYSEYLDLAMEKLKAQDCDAAQKYYNVYKELAGKSVSSMEVLIEDCKAALANGPKQIQINYQNYEVLPGDLEGTYTWSDANSACANLTAFGKSDWYLPTKDELAGLYKQKNEIGGFADYHYWSSTEYISKFVSSNNSWYLSFRDGYQYFHDNGNYSLVRCVRKK